MTFYNDGCYRGSWAAYTLAQCVGATACVRRDRDKTVTVIHGGGDKLALHALAVVPTYWGKKVKPDRQLLERSCIYVDHSSWTTVTSIYWYLANANCNEMHQTHRI